MERKYFDIPEAEATLPTISPLLRRAQQIWDRLESFEQVSIRKKIMTDGSQESYDFSDLDDISDSQLLRLKEDFYATVENIESTGAFIRDLDQGMLDFYTKFEGREVFLSWRQGEKRIRFWHEADEGASGRKRILEF
ncbi:DUF2203 domain-containing protein [Candidatus Woesearchaeota archaeon]|nr:DUF2203 domain-containing protein [Candidatus Woesearchaeota archaeon]